MIVELYKEPQLRGYALEYIAKILLRRERKNNFIFQTNQFDSVNEILTKYRLCTNGHNQEIVLLTNHWRKCDLVEFVLDSVETRNIVQIVVYDVKSKLKTVDRTYYESCFSNHQFMKSCVANNISPFVISMIVFEHWKISFSLIPYFNVRWRVYAKNRLEKTI